MTQAEEFMVNLCTTAPFSPEREKAVKELEALMASPGFYGDRAAADKAVAEHKALLWEVGDLMNQWEMLLAAE